MAEEITVAGESTIEDDVVASIAGMAAREVEGVANLGKSAVRRMVTGAVTGAGGKARHGVAVEVGKKEAIVDLELIIIYGYNIPKVIAEVRNKIATRLLDITGLVAKEINIRVVNIEFPEKKEAKAPKLE